MNYHWGLMEVKGNKVKVSLHAKINLVLSDDLTEVISNGEFADSEKTAKELALIEMILKLNDLKKDGRLGAGVHYKAIGMLKTAIGYEFPVSVPERRYDVADVTGVAVDTEQGYAMFNWLDRLNEQDARIKELEKELNDAV